MKKLKKANRVAIGGAMATNTMQLMKPGVTSTSAMNTLSGSMGIGVTGILSEKLFGCSGERKHKMKKRRRW